MKNIITHALGTCLLATVTLATPAADRTSRIYVVDRNGENLTMVADDSALEGHDFLGSPAWSHDGNWIVFDATKSHRFSHTHLVKIAIAGPGKGKIVDLGVGLGAHYSPDGKRMTFFINGKNPLNVKTGLWVMNADGSDRKRLGWGLHPQWSPDGKRILCTSSHKNPRQLYAFDIEPFKRHVLLTNEVVLGHPGWAPDGKRFALSVQDGNDRVLAIFNPEEKSTSREVLWRQEWHKGYEETWPDWSPNGKQIVFTVYNREEDCGSVDIFIMDAIAGAQPVKLDATPPRTYIRDCQWSPDGKRIAFAGIGGDLLARANQ
jgi:Tol biopolymer transport system component